MINSISLPEIIEINKLTSTPINMNKRYKIEIDPIKSRTPLFEKLNIEMTKGHKLNKKEINKNINRLLII